MAVSLAKLESELYELAKEFPQLRPCGSSPKRFTTYCPIHGKDKTSDVKWRFEGDELVITCEVCGPLTLDQIRNPKPVVSEVKQSASTVELPIESITVDTRAQSRSGIDVDLVSEYADAMREGAIFPPMTVFHDGTTHWLSEGFHRFYAYAKIEVTHCHCVVKQGGLREAILLSAGSNAEHDRSGKRRSNADKRRSVELLLKDEDWRSWSDREIGKQCSVSHEFVRQLRSDLQSNEDAIYQPLTDTASIQEPEEVVPKATNEVRTATRGGTTYTVKTSNIGKPKKVVNPIDSAIKLAISKVFDDMDGELSDEKGIDLAVNILNGLGKSNQTEAKDNLSNSTANSVFKFPCEPVGSPYAPPGTHGFVMLRSASVRNNIDMMKRYGIDGVVKNLRELLFNEGKRVDDDSQLPWNLFPDKDNPVGDPVKYFEMLTDMPWDVIIKLIRLADDELATEMLRIIPTNNDNNELEKLRGELAYMKKMVREVYYCNYSIRLYGGPIGDSEIAFDKEKPAFDKEKPE